MRRLRDGTPTREVAIGTGEGGRNSHSESVSEEGESGLRGGSTSPGTVTFCVRCRGLGAGSVTLPLDPVARGPSSRSLIRG